MRSAHPLRRALIGALAVSSLGAGLLAAGPVAAAPAPVATEIQSVVVTGLAVPGAAANRPSALVEAGTPFSIAVTFGTAGVPTPASHNKDTTVTFAVVDSEAEPGSDAGSAALGALRTLVVPAGEHTATATGYVLTADNRVRLQATVTDGSKDARALGPGHSADLDVVTDVSQLAAASADFLSTAGGTEACVPTESAPFCADLYLPTGSVDGARLSFGLCDGYLGCGTDHPVLQALVGLTGYTREAPATLVFRCDKSKCGNGGVPQFPLLVNLAATGPLTLAPVCTTKGVVNDGDLYCFDYKASSRDNAGDLYLHLQFITDARVSWP